MPVLNPRRYTDPRSRQNLPSYPTMPTSPTAPSGTQDGYTAPTAMQGGSTGLTDINPYARLKATMGQMAVGRLAGAARAQQGRLNQQGTANIPGVAAASMQPLQGQVVEQLGLQNAQVDQQARQEAEQKREFDARLNFAIKQWQTEQDAAKKAQWMSLIGALIAVGGTLGGAAIGAKGERDAAEILARKGG